MYIDPLMINAYSLLHTQGLYEGQRSVGLEKRVVNLTRSAYLGQQRYATIVWGGDVSAKWTVFRKQIADGLNFCVTGMPYWTIDIGGFFVKKRPEYWFWNGDYEQGVEDLGYCELFVRWFQYGAFLPMFRVHGTDTPREIWRFGRPGEMMYEALVQALKMRYRLLPYIYSLAGWTTHQHYTPMRMLPFDFRRDPETYDVNDQFLYGPALMVCPVTKPMYYEKDSMPIEGVEKTRAVYLPKGAGWYDFWTGQFYAGGQTIRAAAPLDILPVFVRAGSILPIGPDIQYANQPTNEPVELRIYPGEDCRFTLYFDENDNYNYENGAFVTVDIEWNEKERCLTIGDRQGYYSGMSDSISFQVVLMADDGTSGDRTRIEYQGERLSIHF
jgi:alpha-D-xyloside xylohydrolase